METIPETIRRRMAPVRIIIARVNTYLDIIRNVLQSVNPEEYQKINSDITSLLELSAEIPDIRPVTDGTLQMLEYMSAVFGKLEILETGFASIFDVFDNRSYAELAMYNKSATYTEEVNRDRNEALAARERYMTFAERDDEKIIKIAIDILAAGDAGDDIFKFIRENENTINKFTIRLFHWFIITATGERQKRAELIVEKQKDIVLGSSRVDLGKYPGVQGVICRYKLLPITQSMPPTDLFKTLGYSYKSEESFDVNLKTLASHGPGIIAINKATESSVEFNLTGLIDLDFIVKNNLKTQPMSGLTKKIITRFNTANRLPPAKTISEKVESDDDETNSETNSNHNSKPISRQISEPIRIVAGTQDTWIVIETINGDLWRQLGLRGDGVIPGNMIIGLTDGLTLRPHYYHSIQTEQILKRCFDKKAALLLDIYAEQNKTIGTSTPLTAKIIGKLTDIMEKKLETMEINLLNFTDVATDKIQVNKVLLSVLIHTTGTYGSRSSEYLMTYVAKLERIQYKFGVEIAGAVREADIPERLFKERKGDDLKSRLLSIYQSILQIAVDKLDSTRVWMEYDMTLKEFFLEEKHIYK